jgi:hypothetical protein
MKRALIIAGCGAALIAIFFGVNGLFALGIQYVLEAFGVNVGFWPCFVALLIFGTVTARFTKESSPWRPRT